MSHTAFADIADLGPATVPNTASYRLHSEAIGQDFLIQVSAPPMPLQPGQTAPALYVTDGNLSFNMAVHIARMLQWGPYPLPQTFIVGLGYHLPERQQHLVHSLRLRDLSPWIDDLADLQTRGQGALPDGVSQGGAAAFLEFIEGQVKPFVASRYPVDTTDQGLLGVSLGGLFALYAMLAKPGAFQRVIAISPAIWWDGRRLLELEADLARTARDLPAKLFLGVGGLEESHDVASRLVTNTYELDARLRQRHYPGLEIHHRVFDGETHMSVFPGAFARGLSEVFGGPGDVSDWARRLREA